MIVETPWHLLPFSIKDEETQLVVIDRNGATVQVLDAEFMQIAQLQVKIANALYFAGVRLSR